MPSARSRLALTIASVRHALAIAEVLAETEPQAAGEALAVAVKRAEKALRPHP